MKRKVIVETDSAQVLEVRALFDQEQANELLKSGEWTLLHGCVAHQDKMGYQEGAVQETHAFITDEICRSPLALCLWTGIGPRDWRLPAYDVLKAQCGGIVGEVTIVDCVTESVSPWFTGEYGFVLKLAKAAEFQPCKGQLGFFEVRDDRLQLAVRMA